MVRVVDTGFGVKRQGKGVTGKKAKSIFLVRQFRRATESVRKENTNISPDDANHTCVLRLR